MDFSQSGTDEAFARSVRAFISASLPQDIADRVRRGFHASRDDWQRWSLLLDKQGWGAPHWPQEFGGPGWTPMQRFIFERECALADAPAPNPFGLALAAPVIFNFGSQQQKARYLPRIKDGSELWCQGFSEPESGSDLASLRTKATRVDQGYVISGQKIWTTSAHIADQMFCIARTSSGEKKQEGISFFIIDMKLPGVTVRPIVTLDMHHNINEVFLDDVRIPFSCLIGQEGEGWRYAKFLLDNERVDGAAVPHSLRDLRLLKSIIAKQGDSVTSARGRLFLSKVARAEIDLKALEWNVLRMLSGDVDDARAFASALKIEGSELLQRIGELIVEAYGADALSLGDRAADGESLQNVPEGEMARFLYRRATTIYAGANEIQKNVIFRCVCRA